MKSLARVSFRGGIVSLAITAFLVVCAFIVRGASLSDNEFLLFAKNHLLPCAQALVVGFLVGALLTAAWHIPVTGIRKIWGYSFHAKTPIDWKLLIKAEFRIFSLQALVFLIGVQALVFGAAMASLHHRGFTLESVVPMLLPECCIALACGLMGRGVATVYLILTVCIAAMMRGNLGDLLGYGFVLGISAAIGYWFNIVGQFVKYRFQLMFQRLTQAFGIPSLEDLVEE